MIDSQHAYEIRPRKDRRGLDLISNRLPLGLLWFERPDAFVDAVNYAKLYSPSHAIIIRLFDESGALIETHELDTRNRLAISANLLKISLGHFANGGNVIETHEHAGDFKEP